MLTMFCKMLRKGSAQCVKSDIRYSEKKKKKAYFILFYSIRLFFYFLFSQ